MSILIGRKLNIGIGKETTRGTAIAASFWLPKMDFSFDDQVDTVIDSSSIGIIEDSQSSDLVKRYAEGTLSGRIANQSFGLLLAATLGTEAAPTLIQTGVYDHVFSLLETAQHPSLTFSVVEPNTTGLRYPLGMIDKMTIDIETGKYATYKMNFTTNTPTAVANTASFAAENIFLPQNCIAYLAPTLPGVNGTLTGTATGTSTTAITALSISTTLLQVGMTVTGTNVPVGAKVAAIVSASAFTLSVATTGAIGTLTFGGAQTNIRSAQINISKNIEDDPTIGSLDPVDRYNKQFAVEGTIELVYNDRSYFDTVMIGDLAKALRIQCINTNVTIGASSFPQLTIDLAKVKLQEVARNNKNDEIMLQTLKFKAFYSIADAQMIAATIRNTQTAAY